jgi:ABC-type Na+ efflux pump permease subunit
MTGFPGTREYRRIEFRLGPWRVALWMIAGGIGGIVLTHSLLPRLPQLAISFLQQGFHLQDMPAVLLFNDIVTVYFAAFFTGISALLQVTVALREERQLELLPAKPVRASEILAARTCPVFAATLLAGVAVSIGCVIAIAPYATNAGVTSVGAFSAGVVLTALVLVQLAALNVVFVRLHDRFHALLIACFVWLLPLMPTATFLYRPDLFEGHDRLTSYVVLASLIWNDAHLFWFGPASLVFAAIACILLVHAGGALLKSTGVDI